MTDELQLRIDKFTFIVAPDRFYNAEGVWAIAAGNLVRIGLSDFLQQRSGDIAFVDLKPEGTLLAVGDEPGVIETMKVTITLSSPVAGTIIHVNPLMDSFPETINQDPYGQGWLCEIEAANWEADRMNLLEPAAYFTLMEREAENEVKKE